MIYLKSTKETPTENGFWQELLGFVMDSRSISLVAFSVEPIREISDHFYKKTKFQFEDIIIQDQIEGDIFLMFWHQSKWLIHGPNVQEFTRQWEKNNLKFPLSSEKEFTFTFVFCNNQDWIIAKETPQGIYLTSARSLRHSCEVSTIDWAKKYEWEMLPIVKDFVKNNPKVEEIQEAVMNVNLMEKCGFIIQNKFFQRTTVSAPQSLALKKLIQEEEDLSEDQKVQLLLTIIKTNPKDSGFLKFYPRFQILYFQLQEMFLIMNNQVEKCVPKILEFVSQSDAAAWGNKFNLGTILMHIRNKKIKSAAEFWRNCNPEVMKWYFDRCFPHFPIDTKFEPFRQSK